jgi:hypothetical protein
MWVSGPATWDSLATHGLAVASYKGTGDRGDLDNHRFVVLLSAISRIIARILATRISEWAERRNLLPSSQWGFRKHKSTQDALFLSRLLVELEAEVRGLEDRPLNELLVLIFLDIQNPEGLSPRAEGKCLDHLQPVGNAAQHHPFVAWIA